VDNYDDLCLRICLLVINMDDQALKQLAIQKEKEWLAVMQERYFIFSHFSLNFKLFFCLDLLH
jgi:hypothetical protein